MPPSSRRRRLLSILAAVLAVVLAFGWSALWVMARDRVEAEIDRALVREAGAGRQIACAERTLSGFPAQITVTCERPLFAQSRGRLFEVTGARLVASAYAWRPRHIHFDITGPLRLAETGPERREIATATFSGGRAVVVQDGDGREAFELEAADVELRLAGLAEPYRSPQVTLAVKRRAAEGAGGHPVDVAATVARFEGPHALPGVYGPIEFAAELTVFALEEVRGATQAERLKSWAAAGGRADIARLRLLSDGAASETAGALSLDRNGRLNGELKVAVHGLDFVLVDLIKSGAVPREMMSVIPTLSAFAPKSELDGRPAMTLPVRLREGLVRVGPAPVGAVPPLF